MCGLAGIYSYNNSANTVNKDELLRMREHMLARGPDGAGLWLDSSGRIGLAHRRLSILDLSDNGAQPMSTPDGKLRIVFNGEIYNYIELRNNLKARGYEFFSNTDTEVLLYSYREYGRRMVEKLQGMFALAIWDEQKHGLLLARDHFGIKPLYYYDDGKAIRFASQVKAILAGNIVNLQQEPAGHVGFYLWGCVPEPYTLYRNLLSLPAGNTLWVDSSGVRGPYKYFDIADELGEASETKHDNDVQEVFNEALRTSVKQHLISDVPVGVFLSSGLDSSNITALASEQINQLQTITLGFDKYLGTSKNEVPLAQKIAAHYGCSHQFEIISKRDFDEELSEIIRSMDQPSVDGVNTYFVARAAKRAGLKVALSGIGGDEILGGYPSFRQIPKMVSVLRRFKSTPGINKFIRTVSSPLLQHLTSPKYASLFEYGGSYGGAYLLRRGFYMPWELNQLLDGEMIREGWASLQPILRIDEWLKPVKSPYAKVAAMELSLYMRNMLLRDTDWAGMAHSLEIRTPMIDIQLFRKLAPYMYNDDGLVSKRLLRTTAKKKLPDAVLAAPKSGFTVPIRKWIEEEGRSSGQRGLRGWAALMMSAQDQLKENFLRKKVLVFRIGSLGDTCVAIPAFRLIRNHFENATIKVLTNFPMGGGVKAAPLKLVIGESGLVDGYFEYPLGLPSHKNTKNCIRELRNWKPDVVIYLMPKRRNKQIVRDYIFFRYFIGVRNIIGMSLLGNANNCTWNIDSQLYESEASRLIRNLSKIGSINLNSTSSWDLGLQDSEIQLPTELIKNKIKEAKYLVCSPGTKIDTKDWGRDRWENWAEKLSINFPNATLVLIGVDAEFELADDIAKHWAGTSINLCGKLSPRESAEILRHASCFVGHDSGPMHLAASVGTPCVAIFSAQDLPGIWFPHGDQHKVIYHKTECFGCRLAFCEVHKKKCIRSITVDEVLTATCEILNRTENRLTKAPHLNLQNMNSELKNSEINPI
jgi:asparagine synthase (glutamine-hydrolysing)